MRKKIILILTLTLLININLYTNTKAETQDAIDLATTPTKILFNVDQLVPGDWATRELLITNNGKEDFEYLTSARLKSGSEKLYNALLLNISDEKGTIFEGELSDFKKLESRFLKRSEEEKLFFKIEMPYELGNEYQGLGVEFEFNFYVEGTLGGVIPVDNRLPTTGTEIFNLLATGAALLLAGFILFSYLKRKKVNTKSS